MNRSTLGDIKASLKRKIKLPLTYVVTAFPGSLQSLLFIPRIRILGERVPVLRIVYTGCYRTHPIDRLLGTDTSGIVPPFLPDVPWVAAGNLPYMGSQPSIVRDALRQLGDTRGSTFVDIGCGKGRPMIIATEFPFAAVLGYDIATPLVDIANRNAAIVMRRFPERTRMQAFTENMLEMELHWPKLVIFLFNPFGQELMTALLGKIEGALGDHSVEQLYIVYLNPACSHVFDASALLVRHSSASFPYAADEIGYGTEEQQDVIIWKNIKCI